MKRQPTEWEKVFITLLSYRKLISSIWEELINVNAKITNNLINKWTN
jgi:hypothetical protein